MFKFLYTLIISPANSEPKEFKNILFCIISVLPPNIFMFHLYSKNAEHIEYWHIFILTTLFSCIGVFMYWVISCAGKSMQGSALVSVFLWAMFFTIHPLYQSLDVFYYSVLSRKFKLILLLTIVLFLTIIIFIIGRRLKNIKIFQILAIFEIVVFLINFFQATGTYISKIAFTDSETNYKTSFNVDINSPSPNIYWIHMDGMLGFEAMEYFFNDQQEEFENQLKERNFIVNREAEFEANHYTTYAIPMLMSPFYYDKNVLSLLKSVNLQNLSKKQRVFQKMANSFNSARLHNELIAAFNAKGYQTNIITENLGYYWYPVTQLSYIPYGKIEYDISNIENTVALDKLNQLNDLMAQATISHIILVPVQRIFEKLYQKRLNIKPVKNYGNDTKGITKILLYENTTWYINALSEIFKNPQPRLTIIDDSKAHFPFAFNEDGSSIARSEKESTDIYNYPPQHRFARKYLVALIDFILANDPEAIIVVQSDHGLHHNNSQRQILSSGGTVDEVCLIYNQTMSAIRIPAKWDSLGDPVDPLNITRVLVNRYVGQNYELLEDHP